MRFSLERAPADPSCAAGFLWYTCSDIDFYGCCSTDPCDAGCPDPASLTKTISTNSPLRTSTLTVSAAQSSTSLPLTSSSAPTTSVLNNADLAGFTTSMTISETGIPTSSPSPSASTASSTSNSTTNSIALIIGGAVAGVVVVSIMSLIIWFCLRRRKQKQNKSSNRYSLQDSLPPYGIPTKDFVLDRTTGPALSLQESEPFAPFGGMSFLSI
ncbi:uncharacterized protein LY89DRAFT_243266 [Mollisia scopiformis]|uniref:Epidermal growth factor receptor-like transmembrane-juxtamembrane segment domain-containing protein n=1 Tax=Mollisia scopiformis TaxID=149040 RepID=A0A194WTS7_MOLSC|nr:uncharacterized protein LY89DRAFT_243266 [Mollisia scopiformis]KUJ11363.1 hypothetical protein LY89DRAFT_243266 [Mollisia scopiformis]